MGTLTNLFGDKNSEKYGDSWIQTYYNRYLKAAKADPCSSPVIHLGLMWLGHFECLPERNQLYLSDSYIEITICTHACIPPPSCARALAVYMLSIEHPHLVERFPRFLQNYEVLMHQILELQHKEDFTELNRRFNAINPRVAKKNPFPIGGMQKYKIIKRVGLWGS